MEYLFFWLAFAAAAGMFAAGRGRSGIGWFFISILISPLLGFIFAAVSANLKEQEEEEKIEKGKRANKAKLLENEKAAEREKEKELAATKQCPMCAELGSVDIHLVAMIVATMFRFALKLVSVLSYLVAIPRNSLILAK